MNVIKVPMKLFSYDKESNWLVAEHSDLYDLFGKDALPRSFTVVSTSGTEVGFFYDRDVMANPGTEDEELSATVFTSPVVATEVHILND